MFIAATAILAAAALLDCGPARGGTISGQGSVSQSVQFRIVIPELPPLVMNDRARSGDLAASGASRISRVDEGGKRVEHVVDRHGRLYTRQVSRAGGRETALIAAP